LRGLVRPVPRCEDGSLCYLWLDTRPQKKKPRSDPEQLRRRLVGLCDGDQVKQTCPSHRGTSFCMQPRHLRRVASCCEQDEMPGLKELRTDDVCLPARELSWSELCALEAPPSPSSSTNSDASPPCGSPVADECHSPLSFTPEQLGSPRRDADPPKPIVFPPFCLGICEIDSPPPSPRAQDDDEEQQQPDPREEEEDNRHNPDPRGTLYAL